MREGDKEIALATLEIVKTADDQSEYEPLKEIELDFRSLKLPAFEKGHADRAIILELDENEDPTHVELIDFKFGQWAVDDLKENPQFKAYAIGLFIKFPSILKIRVRVIQPALQLDTTHTFTRERDYPLMVSQIGSIVKRRNKYLETRDRAMLKTDPDNCGFCAAQATCPIWQDYMVKLANESDVLATQVMPIMNLEDAENADPEEMVRVLRWVKPMEDYLKKIKRLALAVYDTGRMGPELQVIEKKGDAEILDVLFVRDMLRDEYQVPESEFTAACSIGITRIKELVGARAKSGEKGAKQAEAITKLSDQGIIQYGGMIRYVQFARGKKK